MSEQLIVHVVSMLVPLRTLPGWPESPDPSPLYVLGLLFGLPIAVMLLFSLIGKAGEMRSAGRGDTPVEVDEPLWLGGPGGAPGAVTAGQRAALPSATGAATAVTDQSKPESAEVGGASARW